MGGDFQCQGVQRVLHPTETGPERPIRGRVGIKLNLGSVASQVGSLSEWYVFDFEDIFYLN